MSVGEPSAPGKWLFILIPGLGNAISQDIRFRARPHPRGSVAVLNVDQRRSLYDFIVDTVAEAVELGGQYVEVDLYSNSDGYVRLMDRKALGQTCPECGDPIEKIQYLGSACYFCSNCQTE